MIRDFYFYFGFLNIFLSKVHLLFGLVLFLFGLMIIVIIFVVVN